MKNKGFSLVELIVVIAIMAILVGVAVPVYTSYIGKANAAKDEQLLGEINSAFMVAAVDNQIDFDDLTIENNKIAIDANGVVDFDDLYDDLEDTVTTILSGEVKFSTIRNIYYNALTRQFDTVMVVAYGGGYVTMDPEDIAKLKDSTFGEIGMEELLGKVNYATGLLTPDLLEGSPILSDLVMSGSVQLADYLNVDINEEGALDAALAPLVSELAAKLMAEDNTLTQEAAAEKALQQIMANNTVLVAATAPDFDTTELVDTLKDENGGIKDLLKNSATTGDAQTALAQTAMAYALYTAYANQNEIAVSDDPTEVLEAMETDGFRAYMNGNTVQADIEGYLAAMNMINESSDDPKAVSSLLVNGFNDPALVALLNKAAE